MISVKLIHQKEHIEETDSILGAHVVQINCNLWFKGLYSSEHKYEIFPQ